MINLHKKKNLIIQLLLLATSTPAFAKGPLDFDFSPNPAPLECDIPGANEKNSLCLLANSKPLPSNHFELIACKTEENDNVHIVKETLRIDQYHVLAFGEMFFGVSNTFHSFASSVSVTNHYAAYSEPYKITFYTTKSVRNPIGVLPNMMKIVFLDDQEGENLNLKLNCKYIN